MFGSTQFVIITQVGCQLLLLESFLAKSTAS